MLLWCILSVFFVFIDQISKFAVLKCITPSDIITVIPKLFQFVYVENRGAAFSILSGNTSILSIVSLVISIYIIWYMFKKKPTNKLYRISLLLLFSGAVGNMLDRVFRGYVIDFIKTAFVSFPVFNVADIEITIGAFLLIFYLIFVDGKNIKK